MNPAAVALGVVFLVSSVGKLRDPGWPAAAKRFGLPTPLAWPLAALELVLAALLVAHAARPWPALAALLLLAAFTAAAAWHAARNDGVPCNCFGASRDKPTTWRTVARNAVLCVLAGAALL